MIIFFGVIINTCISKNAAVKIKIGVKIDINIIDIFFLS